MKSKNKEIKSKAILMNSKSKFETIIENEAYSKFGSTFISPGKFPLIEYL